MSTQGLKKWALLLTFWLALHTSSLRAQIFTAPLQASTTGTNPVDFEFRADGTLIAKGNYGVGSLLTGDQGSGTRMLWFPNLAAFRAGSVTGTQWNSSSSYNNIGEGSVAFGLNTTASGYASMAVGFGTVAEGYGSVAFGGNTTASNYWSMASGKGTTASGTYSAAFGHDTIANNLEAIASGYSTVASGPNSAAFGQKTIASGFDAFVVGRWNIGGGNSTWNSWIATDPLFEVGNGTSSQHSDALLLDKSGSLTTSGANNQMPNQTLTGSSSVLTEGLGDSRYLAQGATTLALFSGASATGTDAVALSYAAAASGNYAFASGDNTAASGTYTTAIGYHTTAAAYDSFVVGTYNVGKNSSGGSATSGSWATTDPLFEIGDGTSSTPADALVVYKNGNATVQGTLATGSGISSGGVITAQPGGDIPMYSGM
jgi:hypothetical protein